MFSGLPRPSEGIVIADKITGAELTVATNRYLLRGPFEVWWQEGLIDWLERVQPDALVVGANARSLSNPRAIRWMRDRGRPVVGWGLGTQSMYSGVLARWRSLRRSRLIRSLDGVIAYGSRGAAEYRAAGVPADRVFIAYNASTPRPATSPPFRPAVLDPSPKIVFVGRLLASKRIENLIRASASLRGVGEPETWIVGEGPARTALEEEARGRYPRVRFFGALHGRLLEQILDAADLFVLPGRGGLAVQQAMARALPVVVAEADGTQDDLVRPGNGWTVPTGDMAALAEAIQAALSDPIGLRAKGLESYRIVRDEINVDAMADAVVSAVSAVAAAISSGAPRPGRN